ncbi:hypothetical protein E3N88_33351 [Mikania micrantha]|uniref:non-specific serine/threonine protein kinase n=1 Tax=Mikania micrantha TaxID=192012 RepID=A0A5N6MB93_9ASTR|nr:hypothetical protein E3N88_33351 [Mikania micrantha]
MAIGVSRLLWWYLLWFSVEFSVVFSDINPGDEEAVRALKDQWQNTPPSWKRSNDPCSWEGVTCSSSRIVALGLSSMGLVGELVGDIGGLTALTSLDLSFNGGLTGVISPQIGDLKSLSILILAGCSFTGNIPPELGNLKELTFLALNTNNLTGEIPPSLGSLSKLYWLDLAENRLTGSIPVSTSTTPGLDQLKHAKHFHFNKNKLSGRIPEQLFSNEMVLIHVLFDGNQLTGDIPSTIVYVQTLEVLRLDRNALAGEVPLNLNNLTSLSELNLAHNNLFGSLPDLNGMNSLSYVDLSNNSFRQSEPPVWFSTLPSLSTLVMEFGSLKGRLPQELFSLSGIQQVKLKNNELNETLNMGNSISEQLQLVDLQSNEIEAVTLSSDYRNTLELSGNPVCNTALAHTTYCRVQQQTLKAYSTSLANCGSKSCRTNQKLSPQTCECAYPYEGTLYFRAPSFRELSNANVWHSLEMSLWVKLGLTPGSVSLQNPFFNMDDYLQVYLQLFPSKSKRFNRSDVQKMGFYLSNQTYKPPAGFGPYFFIAMPYDFSGHEGASIGVGTIVGITTGCTLLVLTLIGLLLYAVRQKKRAEKAIGLSRPFASWASNGKDGGGAPQLKGARWFSYDELKKSTGSFSQANQIGSGGYGKVYRGTITGGQVVAIKRAQKTSMQGGLEFKTEIELLSRVHHKNLVGLVGFCFEQGEQMLVYEFMSNGTLRDSLSGKSGIYLDWKRRLRIALDTEEHVSTQVKGTMGYLDPEYYMTQQLTDKSDVYSFGVLMLELVTAKPPITKGKYIVREVRMKMDKSNDEDYGVRELMDPSIKNMAYLTGFKMFIQLAMQCVEDSGSDRPSMSDVVKALETILINDGLNTDSTSASSSATDLGSAKTAPRHPYNEVALKRNDSGAFDYSGGYNISAKVEPKCRRRMSPRCLRRELGLRGREVAQMSPERTRDEMSQPSGPEEDGK